ncbi:MAG: Gfo/Idh/MocA family oxidoreductase [Planctomycetota bacterium]
MKRVCMVGLGLMGRRMAKAMAAHGAFRAMWCLDQDADAVRVFGEETGAETVRDLETLLRSGEVDLVYVATPPATHIEYARKGMAAGVPVWLEKPLATDLAESETFAAEVRASGVLACMHFPFAGMGLLRDIAEAMADGSLGRPLRVDLQLQFSQWPRTWHHAGPWLAGPAEGGFCREVLSHFLFLTQRVLGPLTLEEGHVRRGAAGTEEHVTARWSAGGTPVLLHGGVAGGAPDFNRWTLYGERRSMRLEDWGQVSHADANGWQARETGVAGGGSSIGGSLDELMRALAGESHHLATIEEGLGVQRAVEELLARH